MPRGPPRAALSEGPAGCRPCRPRRRHFESSPLRGDFVAVQLAQLPAEAYGGSRETSVNAIVVFTLVFLVVPGAVALRAFRFPREGQLPEWPRTY